MKLKDILKRVGAGIVRDVVPGGGILMDAIGQKYSKDLTGDDLAAQIATDNPELLELEFDVKLEEIKQEGETLRAMLVAESHSTHTTRPYIAKHSFHVLAIATLAIAAGWLWAVYKSGDPLQNILNGWSFALALLAPFVVLLRGYFGLLSHEHKNRLDGAHGPTQPTGLAGILKNFTRGK